LKQISGAVVIWWGGDNLLCVAAANWISFGVVSRRVIAIAQFISQTIIECGA
jgi:hypothetical protein